MRASDRHASGPRARPASVPGPRTAFLQHRRDRSAPAARIETTASPAGHPHAVGVATGPADGLFDVAQETGRAWTLRAKWTRAPLSTTTIPNLPRTDAKVIFTARHEMTIGGGKTPDKSRTLSSHESERFLA